MKADHLFRLFDMTEALVKPSAKSKARALLLRTAKRWGMPLGCRPCIKIPHDRWRGTVGRWMKGLANLLRPIAPRWAAHITSASRTVISPGKPWKRQLMNVQQATRDFSFSMLQQAKEMEEMITSGSDMLRIPFDATFASAPLPEDEAN